MSAKRCVGSTVRTEPSEKASQDSRIFGNVARPLKKPLT